MLQIASGTSTLIAAGIAGNEAVRHLIKEKDPLKLYTEDFTTAATETTPLRAFERETEIEELTFAINSHGIIIIAGKSGCGKTALVEELAYQIVQQRIPSLTGFTILKLSHRKLQANDPSSFWDLLCTNDLQNKINAVFEAIKVAIKNAKNIILFIDEIQDLIRNNPAMFTSFKEELARGQLKIIGATTDDSVLPALQRQEGFNRRTCGLKLGLPTALQCVKILQQLHPSFTNQTAIIEKIVCLAPSIFPTYCYPDSAIKLFDAFHIYVQDHKIETDSLQRLQAIENLARDVLKLPEAILRACQAPSDIQTVLNKLKDLLFPRIQTKKLTSEHITYATEACSQFLRRGDKHVKGISLRFLEDVLVNSCPSDHVNIRRCNLSQLQEQLHTSPHRKEGLEIMLDSLQQEGLYFLLLTHDSSPDEVRETSSPALRATAQPLPPQGHSFQNAETMDSMVRRLGSRFNGPLSEAVREVFQQSPPGASFQASSSALPETKIPLLKKLEERGIPYLFLNSPRSNDSHFRAPSLNLHETAQWLASRSLPTDNPSVHTLKSIETLLLALILSPNSSETTPIEDNAADILSHVNALSPSLSGEEIQHLAFTYGAQFFGNIHECFKSAQSLQEHPLLSPLKPPSIGEDPPSLIKLHIQSFLRGTFPLLHVELSYVCIEWIKRSIPFFFSDDSFYFLNISPIEHLTLTTKKRLIQEQISQVPCNHILLVEDTKFPEEVLPLLTRAHKVIILKPKTPLPPPPQTNPSSPDLVSQALEAGTQLFQQVSGTRSPPLKEKSISPHTVTLEMTPDTIKALFIDSIRQFVKFDSKLVDPFLKFYTALSDGRLKTLSFEIAHAHLMHDLPALQQLRPQPTTPKEIISALQLLHPCHTSDDIAYALDPVLASRFYRLSRTASSLLSFLGSVGGKVIGIIFAFFSRKLISNLFRR